MNSGPRRPAPPALPGARDGLVRALLALAALLLAWSWWRLEGYQIADEVEYLERAYNLVRGDELIDNPAMRAFGYSGLFLPLFAFAELVDLPRFVYVVHGARVLQIALSLALVLATVRLGALLAGRTAGLAAGALMAASPVLLRWGVSPVSGVAAALFVVLALHALFDRSNSRTPAARGLLAGLWLGASLLMAYQVVSILLPLALFVLVFWRRERGLRAALFVGLTACILLQCFLDLGYYGSFGASFAKYLQENFGSTVATAFYRVGRALDLRPLVELAQWIYNRSWGAESADRGIQEQILGAAADVRQRQSPWWYLLHLPRALAWPALALVATGLVRSAVQRRPRLLLVAAIVTLNVIAMSTKGSKEFRLWLPILPMIAVLGGAGFAWIAGEPRGRAARLRMAAAGLLLAGAVALGAAEHARTNARRFGAFWRAAAFVDDAARAGRPARLAVAEAAGAEPELVRVASAYHWAVFLREGRDVELIKLPKHLDHWHRYTDEERQADLEAIATLDWFLVHLPILTERPELMEAVNRDFAVRAVFYDRQVFEGLGPVFALERRSGDPEEPTFFDDARGAEAPRWQRAADGEPLLAFRGDPEVSPDCGLFLLGFDFRPLPGDGLGWITYRWRGGGFGEADYTFVDRITASAGPFAWQNNHSPAYGLRPTSAWGEDLWLREGYLVVPEAEPYRPDGPPRPVGGDYQRGDLIPAQLWFEIVRFDGEGRIEGRLEAVRPSDRLPIAEIAPPGHFPSPQGFRTSPDLLTRAGGLMIPVPARARRRAAGRQASLAP